MDENSTSEPRWLTNKQPTCIDNVWPIHLFYRKKLLPSIEHWYGSYLVGSNLGELTFILKLQMSNDEKEINDPSIKPQNRLCLIFYLPSLKICKSCLHNIICANIPDQLVSLFSCFQTTLPYESERINMMDAREWVSKFRWIS